MTAAKAESDPLLLWSSIGSILFYLVLTYGSAHRTGSGDRLSIQYGKIPFRPLTGLLLSLIANSLNLILATLMMIGQYTDLVGISDISRVIALLIQGMYQGVLATVSVGGVTLNGLWWSYVLITIPALLVATVG